MNRIEEIEHNLNIVRANIAAAAAHPVTLIAVTKTFPVSDVQILKELGIQGVFMFNDLLAMGFQKAVLERGMKIPEDIAIVGFDNINPGSDYQSDVFAIAQDSLLKNVDRKNQVVLFADAGDAGSFSVKDRIRGVTSGINGVVTDVNQQDGFITITPFNINGLNKNENITFENAPSQVKNVLSIATDFGATVNSTSPVG